MLGKGGWSILPASALKQQRSHPGTQRGTRKPSLFWAAGTKPCCHSSNSYFLQIWAGAATEPGLGSGPLRPGAEVSLMCGGSVLPHWDPSNCQQRNKKLAVMRVPFCHHPKLRQPRAGAWGQGSRTQLLEQGGPDAGTFPNQASIGDWPCRGFRALEEVVERSVGKGRRGGRQLSWTYQALKYGWSQDIWKILHLWKKKKKKRCPTPSSCWPVPPLSVEPCGEWSQ